jgi:hypothetical protein
MAALAWHVMMRLKEDAVIAPSPNARRKLAHIFHWHGRGVGLLAFSAADTHLHALLFCSREDAGEFARRVEITLQSHLALHTGFASAYCKAVRDQWHLQNVFHYIHRQREHHGLGLDSQHDASSLSDFLGLRVGNEPMLRLAEEHLPRQFWEQLRRNAGIFGGGAHPPSAEQIRDGIVELPADDLMDAGFSAFGGHEARAKDRVRARTLIAAATKPDLSARQLAQRLKTSVSYVHRLRRRRVPDSHMAAVRKQLHLRVAQRNPTSPAPE